jgi:hypothetical protein
MPPPTPDKKFRNYRREKQAEDRSLTGPLFRFFMPCGFQLREVNPETLAYALATAL